MRISRAFLTHPEFLFRQQAFRFVLRELVRPTWAARLRVWLKKRIRQVGGFVRGLRLGTLAACQSLDDGTPPQAGSPPSSSSRQTLPSASERRTGYNGTRRSK